jgi:hypothetical protein
VSIAGSPDVTIKNAWLILRGTGEVWNCPHSSSCDTMVASAQQDDTTEWTQTGDVGGSLSLLGSGLSARLTEAVRKQVALRTTTQISKNLCAGECRRIRWWGYFMIADYTAEVTYQVTRRYAWWTKNPVTGHVVHRMGNVWVPCGTGLATFSMHAPIAGFFRLYQRACSDAEDCRHIAALDLGWFPPIPPGVPPPVPPFAEAPPPAPGDGDEEPDGGATGGGSAGEADRDADGDAGGNANGSEGPTGPGNGSDEDPDDLGEAPTGRLPDDPGTGDLPGLEQPDQPCGPGGNAGEGTQEPGERLP